MPAYDYKCENCGAIIEFIHSIKLNHVNKPCPKCGKRKLKRLICQSVNIIFKGEESYRSINYINQKAKEEGMLHSDRRPIRPL